METRDEAHVPTLESCPQGAARLPGPHGNQERPRCAQPPPRARAQGSLRLKNPTQVLTRRADFVRASQSLRASTPGFTLQARRREDGEANGVRVGFTCSKKVGNSVARNRAKRRLREVARAVLPEAGREGWDYVLIGRPESTAALPFSRLLEDLASAVERLHTKP
jgi:ribonuclease P protein component